MTEHSADPTGSTCAVLAKPTRFGEMVGVVPALVLWLAILIGGGLRLGLESAWLPALAVPLGIWSLGMRLQVTDSEIRRTFSAGPIGRRTADLGRLESIEWKRTGNALSGGTLMVKDVHGHRVPIYADRFSQRSVWGPRLLAAADRAGAPVDAPARRILSA
jgi:hypothetical protein